MKVNGRLDFIREPKFAGHTEQSGRGFERLFEQNAANLILNCARSNAEDNGDLFIAKSAGDIFRQAVFSFGQLGVVELEVFTRAGGLTALEALGAEQGGNLFRLMEVSEIVTIVVEHTED